MHCTVTNSGFIVRINVYRNQKSFCFSPGLEFIHFEEFQLYSVSPSPGSDVARLFCTRLQAAPVCLRHCQGIARQRMIWFSAHSCVQFIYTKMSSHFALILTTRWGWHQARPQEELLRTPYGRHGPEESDARHPGAGQGFAPIRAVTAPQRSAWNLQRVGRQGNQPGVRLVRHQAREFDRESIRRYVWWLSPQIRLLYGIKRKAAIYLKFDYNTVKQ